MKPFIEMSEFEQWLVCHIPGEIIISEPTDIKITIHGDDVTWEVIQRLAYAIEDGERVLRDESFENGKASAVFDIVESFRQFISDTVNEENEK